MRARTPGTNTELRTARISPFLGLPQVCPTTSSPQPVTTPHCSQLPPKTAVGPGHGCSSYRASMGTMELCHPWGPEAGDPQCPKLSNHRHKNDPGQGSQHALLQHLEAMEVMPGDAEERREIQTHSPALHSPLTSFLTLLHLCNSPQAGPWGHWPPCSDWAPRGLCRLLRSALALAHANSHAARDSQGLSPSQTPWVRLQAPLGCTELQVDWLHPCNRGEERRLHGMAVTESSYKAGGFGTEVPRWHPSSPQFIG